MDNQILCPYCKKTIPLTEALSHQIKENYKRIYQKRLFEEKKKIEEELRIEISKKIKEKLAIEIKDKINENEELKKQNKLLQEQLLELNKLIRQVQFEKEKQRIEMEKKLFEELEKIRRENKEQLEKEFQLKLLEKDKKLNDALKLVEEYKQKLEQGSQQLQGEILELHLEEMLKKEFPLDEIKEVPKGVRGADILQVVKNEFGRSCGTIIWELKRTKNWSQEWIAKLKDDQRTVKAEIAVLVSNVLPQEIKYFGFYQGVWVCQIDSALSLITVLRHSLISIQAIKNSVAGKEEKKEVLWRYLTSVEFQQRLLAIIEAHQQLQEDIEKEKVINCGFEADDLKVNELDLLIKKIKNVKFIPTEKITLKQRAIKDKKEMEKIKKACQIGDECLKTIIKLIMQGVSEKELAFKIEFFIKEKGFDIAFFPLVPLMKTLLYLITILKMEKIKN